MCRNFDAHLCDGGVDGYRSRQHAYDDVCYVLNLKPATPIKPRRNAVHGPHDDENGEMRIFRDQTSVANAKFDQIDKRTVDFITPADDSDAIIGTQSIDVRGDATDTGLAVHPFDVTQKKTEMRREWKGCDRMGQQR